MARIRYVFSGEGRPAPYTGLFTGSTGFSGRGNNLWKPCIQEMGSMAHKIDMLHGSLWDKIILFSVQFFDYCFHYYSFGDYYYLDYYLLFYVLVFFYFLFFYLVVNNF